LPPLTTDFQWEAGKPIWGFDVLFVDDSNDQNWLPTSDVANTYYCARMEGCTNKGHIYMHVKRGYRWGFQQGAQEHLALKRWLE
jgi:hypothetical protein